MSTNKHWLITNFDQTQPDQDVIERYMRVIFRPVRDYAPSDASFKLRIENRGLLHRGTFEVRSEQRMFVSTCYDNDIYSLAEKLKKDLIWQFESWKQTRFLDVAI